VFLQVTQEGVAGKHAQNRLMSRSHQTLGYLLMMRGIKPLFFHLISDVH
jgi:hypothetical protein